jgi:hypothetical protein
MHPLAKQVIECAQQASSSDPTAKESPLPIAVPSPWSLWLLMSLVRQVERQRWVSTILASKLGVDMDAMSVAGAMAQPPVAQLGPVPGYSDWEYYFHGRGCCRSATVIHAFSKKSNSSTTVSSCCGQLAERRLNGHCESSAANGWERGSIAILRGRREVQGRLKPLRRGRVSESSAAASSVKRS